MIPLISNGLAFGSEFMGTMILILLGVGVVANNLLGQTKGNGSGTLHINWGWGIGVMAGVMVAQPTGGQLNPAVTVGLLTSNIVEGRSSANNYGQAVIEIIAQFCGAFVGAVLAWLAYKQHYDTDVDPALKLGTFSTGPAIRNYFWNTLTEAIATFVLVGWVMIAGLSDPKGNGFVPIGVMMLIVGIGASLGGPTGYAINPARDLGPRIAHAVLPIKGKGGSDWAYSWVPVVGPIIGAIVAAILFPLVFKTPLHW